ncbi:ABC transporter substrate-binding protein [Bradyrhizobium sp. Ai1a-2]|uniref:ABC transporter substrate-binding protein n=1 Tax=Bradyrhizobium sp. Ai1a-2 TaxID=196490 RepID=UPI000487D371|nr:ABC transporter substrate-binding protein [Bradyrhizobium sp. Ai1a-2]
MSRLSAALAVVVVASASSICAEEIAPLKIGLMLPYKGVYAVPSEGIDRGFQVAIAEYGGKVAGRRIEIIRADDELTPNVGVQQFNRLVQLEKVDLVAGVVSSSVGIAVSGLADKAQMPLVLANTFADEITAKFCSPYVARTSFSANGFLYNSGKYWASHGIRTAVIMGPDYSAGHSFLGAFKRGFEDGGGKVVQEIWTPFQKTKDWAAALTQASNSGAQIIYSFYAGAEAVQVVKQHADFGLRDKLPLVGDHWVYDKLNWGALGELMVGPKFVTTYLPTVKTEANEKLVARYRQMFKQDPEVNAELGYDNGKAIMLTLEKLGGRMPADKSQFMTTMRGLVFDAPRGKIRFNASNSALLEKVYVVQFAKDAAGEPVPQYVDEFAGADDLPGCTKSF